MGESLNVQEIPHLDSGILHTKTVMRPLVGDSNEENCLQIHS